MDRKIPESCTVETITPEIARRYLESNTVNYRPRNAATVDRYARIMIEGRWKDRHHDGIAFDYNGALGNGQHRLAAIVKSGRTVVMWVHRGCNPVIFLESDRGLRRTEGDRLRRLGFRSDVDVKFAACVAGHMLKGLGRRDTTGLASSYSVQHESLIGSFILELAPAKPKRGQIVAAFCKATLEFDESRVLASAKRYACLDFDGNDDPLHLLLAKAWDGANSRRAKRAPIYAYAVTAIRAALEGRRLHRLMAAERDFGDRPDSGRLSVASPPASPPPSRSANGHAAYAKDMRDRFPFHGI